MRKLSFDAQRQSGKPNGGKNDVTRRGLKDGRNVLENKILTLIRAEMWKILIF